MQVQWDIYLSSSTSYMCARFLRTTQGWKECYALTRCRHRSLSEATGSRACDDIETAPLVDLLVRYELEEDGRVPREGHRREYYRQNTALYNTIPFISIFIQSHVSNYYTLNVKTKSRKGWKEAQSLLETYPESNIASPRGDLLWTTLGQLLELSSTRCWLSWIHYCCKNSALNM